MMNSNGKRLIIIILAILGLHGLMNFVTVGQATGVYVNHNYEYSVVAPNRRDTLTLFQNGQLFSSYYGSGNYSLEYSISGTEVFLHWDDNYKTPIQAAIRPNRMFEVKIVLNRDLDHSYKMLGNT